MKPQHFIVFIICESGSREIIGAFPYFTAADNFLKNYKTESLSAQIKGWEEDKLIFETAYTKNDKSDFVRNIIVDRFRSEGEPLLP
tara:strand:+ start:209 stop:466 length:258 start_codon:yes stop_codon:yes gene_type:complete